MSAQVSKPFSFLLPRCSRRRPLLLCFSLRFTATVGDRHHCHTLPSDVHLLPRQQGEQQISQSLPNPYDLVKEDPIQVCSDLWVRCFARSPDAPPLPNLTGFLKKFDLWILAYQRACAHHTGSFPARIAIHLPHLRSLLSLQMSVLASPRRTHLWGAVTHLLLRSPADPPSTRPISRRKFHAALQNAPPPFQDRVVQELLLLLLEPVFEPRFSSKSHAFRPGRSPHTVLRTLRSQFAGYLWFLKANLSHIVNAFDSDIILPCIQRGTSDRKVLSLIKSALRMPVRPGASQSGEEKVDQLAKKRMKRKMLRASRKKKVLNDNEPKPDPYWLRTFFGFVPGEAASVPNYGHCGILSPLLANICLNELDWWMEERIDKYFRPSKLDSIWKESIDDGCHNPAWPEFVPSSGNEKTRKMDYIRYGSHILIGIRGPREDAAALKKDLIEFCESKYGLRLENSMIEIEHITRGIEFLDHIICRRVIHPTLRYTATGGNIVSQKGVGTLLSITASLQQCIRKFRQLELVKGDKDPEPLPCTPMLYSGQAHTNSQMNNFLETMADWYKYADNRKKVVGFCAYVIRSSLAKLYAARYRLKSRAKVYRIASRDLSHPLRENTRNDAPEYSDLLRMGLVDAIEGVQFSHMSLIPSCDYTPFPRTWVPEHELVLREYIKLQDPKFFCELHKSVKHQELTSPQDYISKVVWDYKICGVWSKSQKRVKEARKLEEGADT
ncbi:nuclear intron maturase 1, mitochondrial-like isoform X1 [Zingiber officinale]|uniref:Domain X domain-containing protein n=2 Tax=Zingiber officinale TaxID=94328 RepID=A0A8J5G0H9_ZINOF|nr:nuclear intron maturase 1, mitochondrial-like isoform X1 [Zingiber officinale]XP_042398460.1 nuclear intron maturase 1, mitochondrial-like isoform X1 [Zingiber officinale]XP_042398461.1 nuclear intron maturase 1, mitochondrial-like isoform X1 [Zingiber officinale]XP_042398462.1 nuclear intron maturase 1, mitochondrial-like isoform X1 [Zingiber officinale]XP_042398463.1 nuclear intron maturase 1, mitochondrial-like isoform X1 [Zingiber officinale]XP_042398464.1 nuclear intron maturase 1, mit